MNEYIEKALQRVPSAKREVLEFIFQFREHGFRDTTVDDTSYDKFMCGYCYYFAAMLKDAFGRGDICLAAPYGHICWKDVNDVPYDFCGITDEYDYLIPISYLGNDIESFKHVPGKNHHATPERVKEIIAQYKKDQLLKEAHLF